MLDAKTIELFQQQCEQQKENRRGDDNPLAALQTPLEVVAFVIELARAGATTTGGLDEGDAIELLLTLVNTDRETLREYASTLGRLGYQAVATRLRQMARQRTRPAKPPNWWPEKLPRRLSPSHLRAIN
jgi:hypothetical protein